MKKNMKKEYKIILIIVILLAYGIINGLLIPETKSSTLMACSCDLNPEIGFTGEIPCNSVFSEKYYFSFLGYFNVYRVGTGKEIILCENGEQTQTRIDINDSAIKYDNKFEKVYNLMGTTLTFIQFNGLIVLTIILVYLVIKKL
jgi:hypothetical protein